MRTAFALLAAFAALSAVPAIADQPAVPQSAPAAAPDTALPIDLPPGANVQSEVDARDKDLLGVVKSVIDTMKAARDQGLIGSTDATGAASSKSAMIDMLTSVPWDKVLRDIHHVHLVSYQSAQTADKFDALGYYEPKLEAGGGKRLLFMTGSVLVAGTSKPQTVSIVLQKSSQIFVCRADGYPDLTYLEPIILKLMLAPHAQPSDAGAEH